MAPGVHSVRLEAVDVAEVDHELQDGPESRRNVAAAQFATVT